jgi:hypothetical protein
MIRFPIEDRVRRVWAILIGMSVLGVSVEAVTIMIHDRLQCLGEGLRISFAFL